ncbi:hypothetical protein B0E53_05450 [Micromonospora sp. MH33]|uniref:hypothetical protein n=1 Tax=Micromonospora sp. MH33 TaxID=1945509 RepID=UPI000D2DB5BC|nr:hypothetical protein [Micromonospora sp. MH33]PSK62641.1 hypothetical protein B0E53_05450 [Micromonospora sp. MH33]
MAIAVSKQSVRRCGWTPVLVAWLGVAWIELANLQNASLLLFLIPPFELAVWLVAITLTVRLAYNARAGRRAAAGAAALLLIIGGWFTNWGLFHPASYWVTHRWAFDEVADGVRQGQIGTSRDYYGKLLPRHLRDLSTNGRAAVVGSQDGKPAVFLPQWVGIPDDAGGYVYLNATPRPDLVVDLFGEPARLAGGQPLADGWWYVLPGD